nr:hypothetical protein [Tanacetum cinerariifolium]
MEQPNPTFAKIPIMDTGKFEQWKFRIQQYLHNKHYALWEVIEFGDSYVAPQEESGTSPASESSAKKKGRTVAITTEDMQKRRNDVKARTTLLLALPDEHQLRFSKYETAQELWGAILKTFQGSETLEQTFNRLQAIIKYEDINQIDEDDIEEMDIKWNMALLKNHALVADDEPPTEFALMAKSSSSSKNEIFDDSLCSKSCKNNTDSLNTKITKLNEALSDRLLESADDTIIDYSRPSPGIESNFSDLQNSNSSVSEHGESSESIMSKPVIKFIKAADSPTVIKTNKVKTIRKPSVKYAEMYKNTSKSLKFDHLAYDYGVWVNKGKTWPKNNYTHKSMSPRNIFHKTSRTSIRVNRPNMNVAQPKRTSYANPAHSYVRRAIPIIILMIKDIGTVVALGGKITGKGCQFLGRLILWQCKKQTIVATSTTEAEYVAAASGCGQVLWIQNQLLDYGRHFIRDCFEKKLISVDHIHTNDNVADLLTKPFDAGRFQYLVDWGIHRILMISLRLIPLSTARIEITNEGTKILVTVDGRPETIFESSIRRNLKLNDEEGISTLPYAENIIKTSALPHDSTPRVTSLDADEGNKDKGTAELSGDDAPIKGRSLETGEEAGVERSTKRGSNDTEELVNVLTSMDVANILTSGVADVSVPPAVEVSTVSVPTASGLVPTVSAIFTTASVVTPYSRRKGKEKMVGSDTPKKKKPQEQIDVQMAREMEEQMAREDQRMDEQIARDAKIA